MTRPRSETALDASGPGTGPQARRCLRTTPSGSQKVLKEISASTLSSHLDVLEQVGLISQEKRRGRYLITMAGRIAIKMAAQIAKRVEVKQDFDGSTGSFY